MNKLTRKQSTETTHCDQDARRRATTVITLALTCIFILSTTRSVSAQYKIKGETCPLPTKVTTEYIPPPTTCDYLFDNGSSTPSAFLPWTLKLGRSTDEIKVAVEGIMSLGQAVLRYPDIFDESNLPDLKPAETITATVRDPSGTVMPGKIELKPGKTPKSEQWYYIFWRSDQALETSTTYNVSITFNNKAIAPCPDTTHLENADIEFDVRTQDALVSDLTPPSLENIELEDILFGSHVNNPSCCIVAKEEGTETACWNQQLIQRYTFDHQNAFHTIDGKEVNDYMLPIFHQYLVDSDTKELTDSSTRISIHLSTEQLAEEYCIVATQYDMIADADVVSDPICINNPHYDGVDAKIDEQLLKVEECITASDSQKMSAKNNLRGLGHTSYANKTLNSNNVYWLTETDAQSSLELLRDNDTAAQCDYQDARVVVAEPPPGGEDPVNAPKDGSVDDNESTKEANESGCNNSLGAQPGLFGLLLLALMWTRLTRGISD